MSQEQIEFLEWVGENYMRMHGGWMHRYANQHQRENLIRSGDLWGIWKNTRQAIEKVFAQQYELAPEKEKKLLEGIQKVVSGEYVPPPTFVIEVVKKLKAAIPVEWDRFTKTDDGFYVVYGWITRKDGQRDFVIFEMWDHETPENVFCTTSSAKWSEEISRTLYGSAEDHNPCRKIDELWKLANTQPTN